MALTAGGPGYASDVPATFMFTMSFTRGPDRPGRSQRHHDAGHRGRHRGALPVQRTARQAARALSTRKHIHERQNLSRAAVYGVLLIAAFFFLAPLYVMLATSFKDAEQIRSGQPAEPAHLAQLRAWALAWSTACTGVDCRGLKPYFMNSVMMAVPAVLISTAWGASTATC
jgi:ABC-type Fe3+ transport system permease subunit